MQAPFKFIRLIAKSDNSEVWLGEHPLVGQVAIKVRPASMHDDYTKCQLEGLQRIRDLRHPHLVQTHAYFPFENSWIFMMELAEQSILDRLKESQSEQTNFPPVELINYIGHAAQFLDYLHAHSLIHASINPTHLLLFKGECKVTGFSLTHPTTGPVPAILRQHQMMVFAAPEVKKGTVSIHSDQYALASTYACLRVGQAEFHSRPPTILLSGLGEPEQRVIVRAWSPDPDERFATCLEFARELGNAIK